MEATEKSSKNSLFKKLGFGGIGLCALLCSLPIIGAALGIGALTAVSAYFEKIGLAILILSIGLLGYWLIKKKDLLTLFRHHAILIAGAKPRQRPVLKD